MISTEKAQTNENFCLKETQKLLQKIGEATSEAVDSVIKFDVQTNSDKICILTVANNFAQDLEYTLNDLQRITIDNFKKGADNKNLKEAVLAFSTFTHSIQSEFGNDVNKLKLALINVIQNLGNKLNPLLDIVGEHSPHTSKWEIVGVLGYVYIAIEKVKLRIQWEHFNYDELQNAFTNVLKIKLVAIENLKDKDDQMTNYCRISRRAVEGILHLLEEVDIDVDHYDDKVRHLTLKITTKIADAIFDYDKAIRTIKGISDLTTYATLCTKTIVPSLREMLNLLDNENLQSSNGKLRNFVLNSVVNGLGCSIRFAGDCERISEN